VLIYVLFALSLNVLIGFTGNISFGHAAYFAIGGYACAILLTTYGWPLAAACRRRWCWPGWWPAWWATSACG
jgi:ABC-type branched-chain amino acid transport system, permease component